MMIFGSVSRFFRQPKACRSIRQSASVPLVPGTTARCFTRTIRLLRLNDNNELTLTCDLTDNIPPYAILSHTWTVHGELVLQDVLRNGGKKKPGYEKILFCGRQAKRDGLDYFWVDTCCIDKSSSAELAKAINSMFRWYRNAAVCYVYLQDVSAGNEQIRQDMCPWDSQFRRSRWFTRGWTLQELLAPRAVKFYSFEGTLLGDRLSLESTIHSVTNIQISALRGSPLDRFPALHRMQWSRSRHTTEEEDAAYCLLGIFDVYIAPIYGEGKMNAMNRLINAIEERTGVSTFPAAHKHPEPTSSFLPETRQANNEPHFLVPFGQNKEFIGREHVLGELVGKILPRTQKNDCQRTVLEGLGGVGKTQVALEAAYRVREQDPNCSIFWASAITMTTFENAYRAIGQALGAPGIEDEKADVKSLVKSALEKCSISWLLIIDNIDDIGLLNNEGVREYLPFNRKGSILFTTRNHEVAVELGVSLRNTLAIDQMSASEALDLLKSELQDHQLQDIQATEEVLKYLAYLPLAIKQASAYMAKRGTTTSQYLLYCQKSDEKQIQLLSADFEDRWRYLRDTNPIAATWLISFQHLERTYPLAVEYLKFICFLAEKDIPISLLPHGEDQEAENEAVGILRGYAFISTREQGGAFDIHRLVRLATRNWVKQEWDVVCTKALQRLAEMYPFPEHENRQIWMAYMTHAQVALIDHSQCKDKEAEAYLLDVVAASNDHLGKYTEAEQMYGETLELRKSELGAEHPDTLDSMNNLASVLHNQGKYEEAEEMCRETLELRMSVLGAKHPSTLGSMNNLANVLNRQGKYEEAEEMHRQTLELRMSVLGAKHPDTLESMNNLALVLGSQGKYEEVEEIYRATVKLQIEVLGQSHPLTLRTYKNLEELLAARAQDVLVQDSDDSEDDGGIAI